MIQVLIGDAIEKLRELPSGSVHCVVTSPPYWGLRDYSRCQCSIGSAVCANESQPGRSANPGNSGSAPKKEPNPDCIVCHGTGIIEGVKDHQLGLEKTPEEYVQHLMEVFREVRRVLREDGTLWLNLGDSYGSGSIGRNDADRPNSQELINGLRGNHPKAKSATEGAQSRELPNNLKPKDLVGIPWRVAFALQADGWYLRSDIIWSKPNPMPESVTDRPTKAHEYIFLLTKSPRYFYDQEAIREPFNFPERKYNPDTSNHKTAELKAIGNRSTAGLHDGRTQYGNPQVGRNIRTVWEITTQPYPEAHFATFPEELPRRCIKAGTSQKGCCPNCGAPWERVKERGAVVEHPERLNRTGDALQFDADAGRYDVGGSLGRMRLSKFIGWQPTCECSESEVIPCTVLDPFAGSGTTGWVARTLGRKAILIELNPLYGKLIVERSMSNIADITSFESEPKEEEIQLGDGKMKETGG